MRCSIWWTFLASARGPSNAPSPSRISAGQRVIGYGGTTLLDPLSVPLRRDVRLLFDASSAAARERFFDLGPRSRDGVSESVPYSSFSVAPRVFSFELPSFRNFDARRGIANGVCGWPAKSDVFFVEKALCAKGVEETYPVLELK